jgi:AraC-like DNA-binding protein
MTFSGRFLLSIIQFAGLRGADINHLIHLSGHDYAYLCVEENRVSSAAYKSVLEHCFLDTNDSLFGLHAGENLNLAAAGLIGQISQTSATIKQALHYCCEFANLGCRALPMKLEEIEAGYILNFIPDEVWESQSELAAKQTIDGALAFMLREFHLLTVQNHYPLEVGFDLVKSEDHEEYVRVFNCPIKYEAGNTYMLFSKEQVESAIVTSDYNLLRILVQYAEDQISDLKSSLGVVAAVRSSILNLMKPNFPSIHEVAINLNVSPRTLQRRLSEEGGSYKSILEETKKKMAINYLGQNKHEISVIADLLGYSDISSFNRSFKRWTSESPAAYRKAH